MTPPITAIPFPFYCKINHDGCFQGVTPKKLERIPGSTPPPRQSFYLPKKGLTSKHLDRRFLLGPFARSSGQILSAEELFMEPT